MLIPGSTEAGSVFSFNGLGDPFSRVDIRARGMGGAGRALADGLNFSSANPALLSSFARAALSSLYFVQRRTLKDNAGTNHVISDGDLGPIQLVLPVGKAVVLGIGLEPLTDMDFSLVKTVDTGQFPHVLTIDGTGGIQALSVGVGKKFGRFAAGARLDLAILGTINETWKRAFTNSTNIGSDGLALPEFLDTQDQYVRTHRGAQASMGALYDVNEKFSLGLALKAGSTIKQTQIFRNIFAARGFEDDVSTKVDVKLPGSIAMGAAYNSGYRWLAAVDYERAFWGGTATGRFDTSELAGGVLYRTGEKDPFSRKRQLELMAGVHQRSLYFATVSGDQVKEMGASVGIAIPFQKRGVGAFRYVLEFGNRGDVGQHGVSERYIRQTFSISGWLR
jgi:hypothetical protein